MIHTHISNSRTLWNYKPQWNSNCIIDGLLKSRNLFSVQTIEYDLMAVCSTDLDPTGNFLLIGLSNGAVDLQGVQDTNYGTMDHISRLNVSPVNLHRVQWNPGDEQFFSMLDNRTLYLVDPVEMRTIDQFSFNLKTTWSEWNPNDKKIIAVSGTESQTRLVDIRSGSSVQTIILGATSGLASHRATRCLWSKRDFNCLIVGDNEGYLHVYDTRKSTRPYLLVGELFGQISGMSFTNDQNTMITSQGTDNRLIQWTYDKCSLRAWPGKFKKPEKLPVASSGTTDNPQGTTSNNVNNSSTTTKSKSKGSVKKKASKRTSTIPVPADAYMRCQFYVTDRHIYCPVPTKVRKSKEVYVYDLESGYRIKTLKSGAVMSQGAYSVSGLLPESLVLYVGGRGRLRVWSLDEDYQRRLEEKNRKYHTTRWDSDDDDDDDDVIARRG